MQQSVCARFGHVPQDYGRHITANDEVPTTFRPSRLDPPHGVVKYRVMLQHNSARHRRRAHLAHAAVVSLHALCCGLPAAALLAAAVSGATSGIALLAETFAPFHAFLHQHELWILALSAALVVFGGVLEANARRTHNHGFPWLFAFSVFCFLANAAIIIAHRA